MIVCVNQYLDLNYRITQSELKYSRNCTIGTATVSELGHEKQVILLKISNVEQLIGTTHL